jgi:hypothetical protein
MPYLKSVSSSVRVGLLSVGGVVDEGLDLAVHVLDAPREVRRFRVQRRNAERGPTFSMVVPDPVFEMASDMWEPPDEVEQSEFSIEFISSEQCE